jgi:hypothetical protein
MPWFFYVIVGAMAVLMLVTVFQASRPSSTQGKITPFKRRSLIDGGVVLILAGGLLIWRPGFGHQVAFGNWTVLNRSLGACMVFLGTVYLFGKKYRPARKVGSPPLARNAYYQPGTPATRWFVRHASRLFMAAMAVIGAIAWMSNGPSQFLPMWLKAALFVVDGLVGIFALVMMVISIFSEYMPRWRE